MKSYIPTINISSLIKNNFNTKKANQTIKQIEKACINVGFFQITGHGINLKEIKNTCNVGNKFFNSSKINKQKLSPKAAAAKKKRDLAFAKTFARKKKKAENQRKRRAAIKAGKNIKGKDYDHKTKRFVSVKENRGNRGRGTRNE